MPPRGITGAIVGFWLVTTGWMLYREIALRYPAGEPPPFGIDLTDEVGAHTISWNLLEKGERVGVGKSSVHRRGNRTFQFYSDFRFDKEALKFLTFKKVTSVTNVTADGKLLGLWAEVEVDSRLPFTDKVKEIKARIEGKVVDEFLRPQLEVETDQQTLKVPLQIKVKVPGNVLNPMLLVNKYRGVSAGQKWRVPLLNPTDFQNLSVPFLDAEVSVADLDWHGQEVACYRIDYREPGKKIAARTWVRQRDGVVLQQEAEHHGRELVLQRDK